jgi:hypothetical protein
MSVRAIRVCLYEHAHAHLQSLPPLPHYRSPSPSLTFSQVFGRIMGQHLPLISLCGVRSGALVNKIASLRACNFQVMFLMHVREVHICLCRYVRICALD